MLEPFDWLRRSRTGAELLATLGYLAQKSSDSAAVEGAVPGDEPAAVEPPLGPPPAAMSGPCLRCWIYPRKTPRFCETCWEILRTVTRYRLFSRSAVMLWGAVSRMPRALRIRVAPASPDEGLPPASRPGSSAGALPPHVSGLYVHDERHFLAALSTHELKPWLQDLLLYDGADLKGILQLFPTVGARGVNMGDVLTRVVHLEAGFPQDRLRVRFYSDISQIFNPRPYERAGVLTFDASGFLNTLELAAVFRHVFTPDEQQMLRHILGKGESGEAQFLWGRFLGMLSQEGRDLIEAWGIRRWSAPQITLLYELLDYVVYSPGP